MKTQKVFPFLAAVWLAFTLGADAQNYTLTGSLSQWRYYHSATLLTNGQVLVTGGRSSLSTVTNSVEIYDPSTGNWSAGSPMGTPRSRHNSVSLTNGCVLVLGGEIDTGAHFTNTCELLDPVTMTWTNTGTMNYRRYIPTATLLRDGRVLVAGWDFYTNTTACELYDPASGTWSLTGSMIARRTNHCAVLLPDGRVLAGGGTVNTNTEIYDPKTGQWTLAGAFHTRRILSQMALLPDGKVLVAGGYYSPSNSTSAEIFDPLTGTWSYTGAMTTNGVGADDSGSMCSLNLLPNGNVLAMVPAKNSEIYNPSSGSWTNTGSINTNRYYAKSVLLRNGRVLFVGGYLIARAELYNSTNAPTQSFSQVYSERQASGSTIISFASTPNGTNVVLASTNCSLPKTSWPSLGRTVEISPGLYQFADPSANDYPLRFYRIRSP